MDEARYQRMERTMEFLLEQAARSEAKAAAEHASIREELQILVRTSVRDHQRIQQAEIEIEAIRNGTLELMEAQKETARQMQETERQMKETDRKFSLWLERQLGRKNGQNSA